MKTLALTIGALSLLAFAPPVRAQSTPAVIVSDCTTLSGLPTGPGQPLFEDTTGKLCGLGATGGTTTTKPAAAISTGYQQITSLSAAAGFTPPATTTFCLVIAEAQPLRFRSDGVAPTATVGAPMAVGQPFFFRMSIAGLTAIQFIQQASGGILNVSCFKDA